MLAQSFHLLDQAYAAFYKYAGWIRSRETINVRVVSGNPSHEKAFSIEPTDDVVIMTTQTATNGHGTTRCPALISSRCRSAEDGGASASALPSW